jgi:hypothetical protein
MSQYSVLASEGRQRYSVYTKKPKKLWENKYQQKLAIYISKVGKRAPMLLHHGGGKSAVYYPLHECA